MITRAALLAAILAASSGAAQVPLSIDTSFRVDLPSRNVFDVWPLDDGNVMISGYLDFPDLPSTRAGGRLLPNGVRDLSFNWGFVPMGGKMAPWQDRYYAQNDQIVRRFMMNGNLDPSFITMNSDPYFSSLNGGDYHVFPDGRVLMTGMHTIDAPQLGFDGVYNLIWFFNDGHLDTTRMHRTGNGINWAIKEYPAGTAGGLEGRFLVDTWGTTYEGAPVDKVFRIHADGALDTTFRSHIEWGFVWEIEPLPDGRAYLGGAFRMEGGTDTLCVIRVMPDGSLDPTFNNALRFRIGQGFTANFPGVTCVYPMAPGLLALTGFFAEVDELERGSICMIDTTGQLVQAYFDGASCGSYQYFTSVYSDINGIAQAPNGDYYIWGAYHGYDDGTTNDTLQRMVSRLHGGEIGLGMWHQREESAIMTLYPNPSNGTATLELEQMRSDAQLVVRDALGREVHHQRITAYTTTVTAPHSGVYMVELWNNGERIATKRWSCE